MYRSLRPVYRRVGSPDPTYLFYDDVLYGTWNIGPDYNGRGAYVCVKDTALSPEYIMGRWYIKHHKESPKVNHIIHWWIPHVHVTCFISGNVRTCAPKVLAYATLFGIFRIGHCFLHLVQNTVHTKCRSPCNLTWPSVDNMSNWSWGLKYLCFNKTGHLMFLNTQLQNFICDVYVFCRLCPWNSDFGVQA